MFPPLDRRDRPDGDEAWDALERQMPRWSTIVTAVLAAVLLASLGLLLWSILIGTPSGAGAIR